jgi:DNA-binding CsgD family transcriptional regulator
MPAKLPNGPPKNVAFSVQLNVSFSSRELEFIKYRIGKEMGFKEIAGMMGITPRTVANLAQSVNTKLGLSVIGAGRTGSDTPVIALTKWAIAHKLATLEGEK